MNPSLIKKPAAYLPVAMSLTALALVLLHAARYGIIHEADEGPTAHLFQMLMTAQLPLVAFFASKWLPEAQDKPCACWPCKSARPSPLLFPAIGVPKQPSGHASAAFVVTPTRGLNV